MSASDEATLKKKFFAEVNPPQGWPWKQNGTTVVADAIVLEVMNNWRNFLQKNNLTKRLWTLILPADGNVYYHYNIWVTGFYVAYMFDQNFEGRTTHIDWWFESNLRSFGYCRAL